MERVVGARPGAHLARVKLDHPEVQTLLGERAIALPCRAPDATYRL